MSKKRAIKNIVADLETLKAYWCNEFCKKKVRIICDGDEPDYCETVHLIDEVIERLKGK